MIAPPGSQVPSGCTCGQPRAEGVMHRTSGPCYVNVAAGQQPAVDLVAAILALPLPQPCEELSAYWKCDACGGHGEVGEPMYQGYFQPPENQLCPDCRGAGRVQCTAYVEEQLIELRTAAANLVRASLPK